MESAFIASTLVALRQVQGAEEESVLCGGKEEAGGSCLEQRSLQENKCSMRGFPRATGGDLVEWASALLPGFLTVVLSQVSFTHVHSPDGTSLTLLL